MPSDIFKKRKIAVLGSRAVGKSSLVVQYVEDTYIENYYPTIENTFTKTIAYNGEDYECDIIDTAGQDEFSILNAKHAIGIHGYVLVYSVASRASFDMVRIVYDKIIDFCGLQSVPTVLVGQKSDLTRREVSAAQAKALADKLGCACIETSARENINVDKVFELCLAQIEKKYRRRGVQEPPPGRCIIQ
ncbi:hypothetical protein EXIGLDRAFT_157703 [Exidia glandulosa HHB12029]|uniref:Uncharacterized protein n=1 Tax=Exidia glandulosa HHB12029 TaxID=1314781 RepID=A0A165N971_EXIGL|nr:hypothetical protein EXIGLDRAFT_157703 [Exidia glandulosa HHB12029]